MNLPFSPTFFRKIDIFQQLMEYESQKKYKHLWNGIKAVVVWTAGSNHQHLGSSIDTEHVKDALSDSVSEKYISEDEKSIYQSNARHIIETLPVYGFADSVLSTDPKKPMVRINRNCILAGQILVETNFLKDKRKYTLWVGIWWAILFIAALLLIFQLIGAVKNVFDKQSTQNVQTTNKQLRFYKNKTR